MTTFMTATNARKNFYALIDQAHHLGSPVAITHEGLPKVVVLSFEEYEGLMETLEIMSDPETARELRETMKELEEGRLHENTIPFEEVLKQLGKKKKQRRTKR